MASMIKWKQSDYLTLGRAVSLFNKKVRELESSGNEYLPDLIDYKKIKEDIFSRQELKRVVNSLRDFTKEGATDIISLTDTFKTTRWEAKNIRRMRNRAIRSLEKERIELEDRIWHFGMGEARIDAIDSTIENFRKLEKLNKEDLKRNIERIKNLGRYDIEVKKAKVFRDNFLKSLDSLEGYDNVDKLKDYLKRYKNPISFYEIVNKSEVLKDIFVYYRDSGSAQTYGGFRNNQEAFNKGLVEIGLII